MISWLPDPSRNSTCLPNFSRNTNLLVKLNWYFVSVVTLKSVNKLIVYLDKIIYLSRTLTAHNVDHRPFILQVAGKEKVQGGKEAEHRNIYYPEGLKMNCVTKKHKPKCELCSKEVRTKILECKLGNSHGPVVECRQDEHTTRRQVACRTRFTR